MNNISRKAKQIANAKIKGHKNKDIGKIQYPNASPASQAVLVSTTLNKPEVVQYMEQSKLIALKEANITWARIIAPINDALTATKASGDTDHTIRLAASKQARELMQDKNMSEETKQQVASLPGDIDEIQLIKLIKNKA
jgi:hypothetical protein